MKKQVKPSDITFVLQGPVIKDITILSIQKIKILFPGSQIILSTWENSQLSGIVVDKCILTADPGTTIDAFDKNNQPYFVNINRQILSTFQGIKSVTTKYCVKMRTDNYLEKNSLLEWLFMFEARDKRFSIFNNRIVSSNYFAKEFAKGVRIPYFISDFFQFGETSDLLTLWDIGFYEAYSFNEKIKNKMQHKYYPHRLLHVEQELWLKLLNKFEHIELHDEYGTKQDIEKSYQYMINNIIIVDGDLLGLVVPDRLKEVNYSPYYFYSFERWKWLYEKTFKIDLKVNLGFKLKWSLAYIYNFLTTGYRVKARSYLFHRKDRRQGYSK
ncbi:WavE lipopolysaccharide synthesis family protein [Psychromonas sp.]|uniref:WavE lipopolysaccharide synthesis family protein n=1 Tax=Psychromonas sp. TaxID=1884585 RepID=UPI0035653F0E